MFGKFQDLLKDCLLKINTLNVLNSNNNASKSPNLKQMTTKEFHNSRVDQLNLIENEFKDKAKRIEVKIIRKIFILNFIL